MSNHRHHRRNTEEYIEEMQAFDEENHIDKDPDINLDAILSNRSKSALSKVFGVKKSDLKKGSLQRRLGNPKKRLQDHESQAMLDWSTDVTNREKIPEADPVAKKRFFQKLHGQTEVRKHPNTGERMFLMHRGVHPTKYDYHHNNLSSWTPSMDTARAFAQDHVEQIGNDVEFNPDGSVNNKNLYASALADSHEISHLDDLKPKIHSAWIPESAIHNYVNNAIETENDKDSSNSSEQEYIIKPHKYIYAKKQKLPKEQIVDQKINLKAGKTGDKASYKARSLKQIKPRETHQGQFGWTGEEKKLAASEKDTSINLNKTLEAGSTNVAPSNLTGGSALQVEELSNDLQKPFKSKRQRRFLYANPEKIGGKKALKEWESKTPDNIPEKVAKKDKIPGGLADKKKPSDFNQKDLEEGIKVEMEHTSDRKIAREISMDHLTEDKDYYKKLKTIEKSEFIRRGALLLGLGAGMQHLHNESVENAKPIRREIASVETQKPLTEPEKAYGAAQKDAFSIAAKHLPLSRNLARQTIKESPDLSAAHGYVMHLSPSAYKEVVANNPQIKQDVAAYHYDKLYELHGGNQEKIFEDYKNRAKNIQKPIIPEK